MNNSFRRIIASSFLLLGYIAVSVPGCGGKASKVLGAPPEAAATITVREVSHTVAGKPVTLQGEMTEKCPVAGCWFMLKDKTGIVRVDTKASGFVVSDVPLHSTVTVSGSVIAGAESGLTATGVRY